MKPNFCQLLNMNTLCEVLGVDTLKSLNKRQQKARKNIKYCVDDQTQYLNEWYDRENENARAYLLDPEALFREVSADSKRNIYRPGFCASDTQEELKDIRLCGNKFLDTVTLYYVIDLIDEIFSELGGTEEEATKITDALFRLKNQVGC